MEVVAYGNVDRIYGYDGFSRCGYPLHDAYFQMSADYHILIM